MRKLSTIIFLLLLIGCQDSTESFKHSNTDIKEESPKVLSENALNEFQNIFGDTEFYGKKYKFTSIGEYIPKLDLDHLTIEDTADFSFFILHADTFNIKIAIHRKLCFASILSSFREFEYPQQFAIYPSDFSWLNDEELKVKFNCKNEDPLKYRELTYHKYNLGTWKVDSTFMNESPNKIETIEFSDSIVSFNDTLQYKYNQSGFYLTTENPTKYIYRILVNEFYAIFYSTLGKETTTFYCSKK